MPDRLAGTRPIVLDVPRHRCEPPKMPHLDDSKSGHKVAEWRCDDCGQRWEYEYDRNSENRYRWNWFTKGRASRAWRRRAINELQREVDEA